MVQPFEDNIKISVYTGKSETISDMLLQKCPTDLSCVIRGIQQSPRIPGNIAIIVQLLHNISTALWTGVDEEKMRVSVPEYLEEHYLSGKGIQVSSSIM